MQWREGRREGGQRRGTDKLLLSTATFLRFGSTRESACIRVHVCMLTNADNQTVKVLPETEMQFTCTVPTPPSLSLHHLYLQSVNLIQMMFARPVHLHAPSSTTTLLSGKERELQRRNTQRLEKKDRKSYSLKEGEAASEKGEIKIICQQITCYPECCLVAAGRISAIPSDDVSGFAIDGFKNT